MRRINTLEERIRLRRQHSRAVGTWKIGTVYHTECAEQVELLSHEFIVEYLDRTAPFGEVFSCSMLIAREAVERALKQLDLLHLARREDSFPWVKLKKAPSEQTKSSFSSMSVPGRLQTFDVRA